MSDHPFPTLVEISVYSRPGCQQCRTTTRHLEKLGLPYRYRDVTEDADAYNVVQALGYQSLPVITAGDMHWSGYRNEKLKWLAEIHGLNADIEPLDAEAEDFLADDAL